MNECMSPLYANMGYTCVQGHDRGALIGYWKKYLMARAISVFKWTMPDTWSENYFKWTLYSLGYVAVIYSDQYGWLPQRCSLGGYNIFDEPDRVIIANQFFQNFDRRIGLGAVLFRVNADYTGIVDMLDYYATELAEMTLTIYSNLITSKVGYVFAVPDKKTKDQVAKMLDQILNGEPATIQKTGQGKMEALDFFQQNVKQSYIVTDVLRDLRQLMNMFDTEFGLGNANTEKRERLISDEVNANNEETYCRADMWLDGFKESCHRVNEQAGKELMSVDWRFKRNVRNTEGNVSV